MGTHSACSAHLHTFWQVLHILIAMGQNRLSWPQEVSWLQDMSWLQDVSWLRSVLMGSTVYTCCMYIRSAPPTLIGNMYTLCIAMGPNRVSNYKKSPLCTHAACMDVCTFKCSPAHIITNSGRRVGGGEVRKVLEDLPLVHLDIWSLQRNLGRRKSWNDVFVGTYVYSQVYKHILQWNPQMQTLLGPRVSWLERCPDSLGGRYIELRWCVRCVVGKFVDMDMYIHT